MSRHGLWLHRDTDFLPDKVEGMGRSRDRALLPSVHKVKEGGMKKWMRTMEFWFSSCLCLRFSKFF